MALRAAGEEESKNEQKNKKKREAFSLLWEVQPAASFLLLLFGPDDSRPQKMIFGWKAKVEAVFCWRREFPVPRSSGAAVAAT